MKQWFYNLYYSFPIQLMVFHIRSNHLLLAMWVILVLFISGGLAPKFGARYLFLDPEYLGKVDFWSFLFLGFAYGGFLMSWNLTTYLLSSHQFVFLATLSRPFTKFSLNNLILPIGILFFYVFNIIIFQHSAFSAYEIFLNCLGFLFGGFTLILFYSIYFHFTNRDINFYKKHKRTPPNLIRKIAPGRRNVNITYIKQDTNRWRVNTFLNESLQTRLVRSVAHYDSKLLSNIFKQNHLNALLIQLLSMLLLVSIGYLFNNPAFRIPAGASILIFMSLLIAIIGALHYWFNEWNTTIIILLLVGINYITSLGFFFHPNQAYGLDYQKPYPAYQNDSLTQLCLSGRVDKHKQNTTQILNNWKVKVSQSYTQPLEKPKMVILAVSGGGLKAALWTVHVLQQTDSLLNRGLFNHTVLISGASGGMMGASYFREVYLQGLKDPSVNPYHPIHLENISKDILNSIAFSIITKDLFIPHKTHKINGLKYTFDRGAVFEQQFNENTNHVLDKKLADYYLPEKQALIPLLFFTPTIINDARKLIISPHNVSYMMTPPIGTSQPDIVEIDAVDLRKIIGNKQTDNIQFPSVIRMNATYPYVLPTVYLPSDPQLQIMDAGILDNFGLFSSIRFIHVFKDWIKANTSGVILVQISSSEKFETLEQTGPTGIITALFNPIGWTSKLFTIQEYNFDNDIGFLYELLGTERFDIVRFICKPGKKDATVSFHLTNQEKQIVQDAYLSEYNQNSLLKLRRLLNTSYSLDLENKQPENFHIYKK